MIQWMSEKTVSILGFASYRPPSCQIIISLFNIETSITVDDPFSTHPNLCLALYTLCIVCFSLVIQCIFFLTTDSKLHLSIYWAYCSSMSTSCLFKHPTTHTHASFKTFSAGCCLSLLLSLVSQCIYGFVPLALSLSICGVLSSCL
jgi:hypothetical protein